MAIVTRAGCERIVRYAFEYALKHGRRKVTIVHKANILKMVSGLFLEVGRDIAKEYEGRVEANDMIVDNTAMQLVLRPEQFDVMVTTNMFGDILSDEVSGLVGGLGLAPGANIGTKAAIFEAVHGSAPDIAGQGGRQSLGPDARRRDDARPSRRARPRRAAPDARWSRRSCATRSAPAISAAPPPPRSSGVPSLGGSPEVPCARCGERVARPPWGEYCAECRRGAAPAARGGSPTASPSPRRC